MTSGRAKLVWRRANACEANTCVEVARVHGEILVRDSKAPKGSVLRFSPTQWLAFVRAVRAGEFDV